MKRALDAIRGRLGGGLRRRVPVIRQLTPIECGAASLAMILGYHGRTTPVSEARDRLGVGRDGVTAQAIS
jgi:ABC-type bacteriocin/lantibiotic exporter with double-glycine peptidase domain